MTFALVAITFAACASSVSPDPGLEHIALSKVAPRAVIPGTALALVGESFVDEMWGAATLHLTGEADGQGIDVRWPAKFVDFNTMTVAITSGNLDEVGGAVDFSGTATLEVVATTDGKTYKSMPLDVDLEFRETLTPTPTGLLDGLHFVNDQIEVDGDGFLLGGDEGVSVARVTGCFTLDSGGGCTPVASVDIPLLPREALSRQHAAFAFAPKIAGIRPGTFTGEVTIVNQQIARPEIAADPINAGFTLVTAQIFTIDPPAASLGQYMFVHGGGFVGGEAGANTELDLAGTFNKTGGNPAPIAMTLIPEFVEGKLVRYVLNTDDALGRALDLQTDTGEFTGTITPVVTFNGVTVRGEDTPASLTISPVRQVVFLNFTPSYVEGLRDFGMRAVEKRIRDRIIEVCKQAYKGVNVEFRTEPVTDYALYEHVDITGVDPNDMGLFGYDNSPGKDNGNVRLYDRLGGVNALTQQDGYPGYGGVFIRSLMGFSKHPGAFARSIEGADPLFDQIFDGFRADVDGSPIVGADLASGFEPRTTGTGCPAADRLDQIECGVFVIGNLIGGTLSHEIGHSLGLANPFAEGFHNAGDQPNRIMDSGGDRPFLERAELNDVGPGVFCDDEYAYLRMILPTSEPPNAVERPGCF
ncbi:MAG: hypothetical protein H0T79_10835 [Deltaproteobacteria bacterium]|nr:hypothetical protein [Deltaproteobacteria bacterium]